MAATLPSAFGRYAGTVSTRHPDEGDDANNAGNDAGNDAANNGGDNAKDQPAESEPQASPLDELFVVGAKYHEPSAAEREAAAKAAERDNKKAAKAREKEIERTRRVLEGGNRHPGRRERAEPTVASHDRRVAAIGFSVMVALSVVLSFTAFGH